MLLTRRRIADSLGVWIGWADSLKLEIKIWLVIVNLNISKLSICFVTMIGIFTLSDSPMVGSFFKTNRPIRISQSCRNRIVIFQSMGKL